MPDTVAPSAAPATSTPAAPSSAPSSTSAPPPGSSTPSTQPALQSSGSHAQDIKNLFARLDSDAEQQPAPVADVPAAEEPGESPVAALDETPETQAAEPAEQTPEDAQQIRIRKELQAIADPKVRERITNLAFMGAAVARTGLPFDSVRQFIQDAPVYLSKAPTVDVFNARMAVADTADALGGAFMSGTPEGFQNFTTSLAQAHPQSFANYLAHLFQYGDAIETSIERDYGKGLADVVRQARDAHTDRRIRNAFRYARERGQAALEKAERGEKVDPNDELLIEAAGVLEKAFGFDKPAPQQGPRPVDPRDQRIRELEAQQQASVEQARQNFMAGITERAQPQIDKLVDEIIGPRVASFTEAARTDALKEIRRDLYRELNEGVGVGQRVDAIHQKHGWSGTPAHADELTNEFVRVTKGLLAGIAPQYLKKYAGYSGVQQKDRQRRIAAQVARRDPGAAGSPQSPRQVPDLRTAKSPDEMFALLDARDAER